MQETGLRQNVKENNCDQGIYTIEQLFFSRIVFITYDNIIKNIIYNMYLIFHHAEGIHLAYKTNMLLSVKNIFTFIVRYNK